MPCDDLFHDAWIKTKKGDLQSIHEGIKQQIMIARQTSEPKRTNLQYKDLVQKPSLSLRSKIKKKKEWEKFITTTNNQKTSSIHSKGTSNIPNVNICTLLSVQMFRLL